MRDTVELPLSVISSNLELIVNREIDLQKPVDIEALRYPVVITLYDDAYRAYNDSISSLLRHYCFRIDQRMARFAAKREMCIRDRSYNAPVMQYFAENISNIVKSGRAL